MCSAGSYAVILLLLLQLLTNVWIIFKDLAAFINYFPGTTVKQKEVEDICVRAWGETLLEEMAIKFQFPAGGRELENQWPYTPSKSIPELTSTKLEDLNQTGEETKLGKQKGL